MENKKPVTCYDLQVSGLFGRNRKPKLETFTLAKYLDVSLSEEEAISLANAKIAAIKPKGTLNFAIVERKGTLENDSGVQIYTTRLFQDTKVILKGTR